MDSSETFGIEKGHGDQAIAWLNQTADQAGMKFEARKYGYSIDTENFGSFEMFSWVGDVQYARKLIIKVGKKFKIKTIEGGYKPKERTITVNKIDYAMVRRRDKIIGHLQFEIPRLGNNQWRIAAEERR